MVDDDNEKKINLTFLFCNWYSGGTLFSIVLNSSSDIVCNGEAFPWQDEGLDNDCTCGEAIIDCQFYNYCASEMKKNDGSFNLDIFRVLPKLSRVKIVDRYINSFFSPPVIIEFVLKLCPTWRNKLDFFIKSHVDFFKKAIDYEKSVMYVDGTKNIRRAELFARADNINLKVIHLVRDGRGFCNSWVKNRGVDKEQGLKIAAHDWNNYISQVDKFTIRYPEVPLLTVKYEDLCTNLDLQKKKIHSFLCLSGEWKKIGDDVTHILGNRMRRSFSGEIRQDMSWQSELSSEQIELIESVMVRKLKEFDYI